MKMIVIPYAIWSLCPLCNAQGIIDSYKTKLEVSLPARARLRLVELISRGKKNYSHSSVWRSTPYEIVQKAFGWTVLSYRESY